MATKADAEFLAELAVESDAFDGLRDRAAGMVGKMMTQAERILEVGTPADKATFTKTVLPAILKQLQEKKDGDDLAELRQAQADLMSDVREALLRGQPEDPQAVPDVPADGGSDDAPAVPRRARKAPVKKAPKGKARGSTTR